MHLTPDLLLKAYAAGVFPMAETREASDVYWVEPKLRGIIPLDGFHLPRSLARVVRADRFTVRVNTAFRQVMIGCAEARPGREETWINDKIISAYSQLQATGRAHSVECWRDGALVGGLYGVALGGAFFGESMFSRQTDASKVALVHLVARLRVGGYQLLDTQFITHHLARFGAIELPRNDYLAMLHASLISPADFFAIDALHSPGADQESPTTTVSGPLSGKRIAQLASQTS